jgi:hypothetical protein
MANNYMKNCSTPLAIREILIQSTLRFYPTLIRMVVKRVNISEEVCEKEPLYMIGRNVN